MLAEGKKIQYFYGILLFAQEKQNKTKPWNNHIHETQRPGVSLLKRARTWMPSAQHPAPQAGGAGLDRG